MQSIFYYFFFLSFLSFFLSCFLSITPLKQYKQVYFWLGGGIRAIQFEDGKVLWVKNEKEFAKICYQYNGIERFWVSINPLKDTSERTKVNVKSLMNIVIDVDSEGGKNEETVQIVKKVLDYIEEKTSITSIPIIFSGHKGFHIWLQLKPIELGETWEEYDKLLRVFIDNLAKQFNTQSAKIDEKVKGIERVIGIPFTVHTTSGKLVKPVNPSIFHEGRYEFNEFNELLLNQSLSLNQGIRSPKEFEEAPSFITKILHGAQVGERNNGAFKLASYFKDFEIPQEITMWIVNLWNKSYNKEPLVEREIKSTVRSAYKRPIIPKTSSIGVIELE